jgi:hypothetical protein
MLRELRGLIQDLINPYPRHRYYLRGRPGPACAKKLQESKTADGGRFPGRTGSIPVQRRNLLPDLHRS